MDCAHEEVLTPSLTVDLVTFDQSMMEATSDPPQLLQSGTIVEADAFHQFVMTFALDSPQLMDSSTITPKSGLVVGPLSQSQIKLRHWCQERRRVMSLVWCGCSKSSNGKMAWWRG